MPVGNHSLSILLLKGNLLSEWRQIFQDQMIYLDDVFILLVYSQTGGSDIPVPENCLSLQV